MVQRLRRREGGFTLIELLIVVAIIGIIAALLIPNFLDALQKAKQKRTVADARNVGTAMMSWLTDEVAAAAAGGTSTISLADYANIAQSGLSGVLVPQYIQEVPARDGWKNDYLYYLRVSAPMAANAMAIASAGRGAEWMEGAYTVGPFEPTDYAQDIVWADGFFVRWPQKPSSTVVE